MINQGLNHCSWRFVDLYFSLNASSSGWCPFHRVHWNCPDHGLQILSGTKKEPKLYHTHGISPNSNYFIILNRLVEPRIGPKVEIRSQLTANGSNKTCFSHVWKDMWLILQESSIYTPIPPSFLYLSHFFSVLQDITTSVFREFSKC